MHKFKHIDQAIKPKDLKNSVQVFLEIKKYFNIFLSVINLLHLSPNSCQYYAVWVKKATIAQLNQFADQNKVYLYMIVFIEHQFYLRQDFLMDVVIKCVQAANNAAENKLNKQEQKTRKQRRAAVKHLKKSRKNYQTLIDEIRNIIKSLILTNRKRV